MSDSGAQLTDNMEPREFASELPAEVRHLVNRLRVLMSRWIRDGKLDVPTIPTIIAQAMRLASDPETPISEIEKLIEKDQSVAGRLMQIANSSLLRRARDADTIREAMVRIGQHELKHTLFSLFVETRLFANQDYQKLINALWKHSMACASMARRISPYANTDPEVAFLAGLVHDVGKAALLGNIPDEIQNRRIFPEIMLERAMQEVHELAGGIAAKRWHMSASVVEAVIRHHEPQKAEKNPALAKCIYVSNLLVYHFGIGINTAPISEETDRDKFYRPLFARYNEVQNMNLLEDPIFQELEIDEVAMASLEREAQKVEREAESSFSSSRQKLKKVTKANDDEDEVIVVDPRKKTWLYIGIAASLVSVGIVGAMLIRSLL